MHAFYFDNNLTGTAWKASYECFLCMQYARYFISSQGEFYSERLVTDFYQCDCLQEAKLLRKLTSKRSQSTGSSSVRIPPVLQLEKEVVKVRYALIFFCLQFYPFPVKNRVIMTSPFPCEIANLFLKLKDGQLYI